jgi:parallel beta-helix repeat protein
MPSIPGSVPITGFVAPTDDADTYPSHSEEYGKGGYRSVGTNTDRDAIPAARRKAGMVVKVLANKMEYVLGAGLGNGDWEKNPSGAMELGSYSELEALNGSQLVDGSTFFCRYRDSQDYGGSGHFYFSSSSTITADGAMVLQPADNSGRFFRFWDGGMLNILWFGARPTLGASLTPGGTFDNSVPINAAINWARTPTIGPTDVRASVFIPAGDFWISNSIVNRYRVDVIGLGCVFSDNEFTSHSVSSSGMVSGASRIRLADGANCPMMTWSLSDASKRYTFAYTDDGLTMTATVSVASPGVITCVAHGLTVGRRVGFTTTGALPTGITASTIYYVQSVPTADTLTISATSVGAAINTSGTQSGIHTLIKDPTTKYVAGNTIKGINFFGNSANQTRYDCHIIKVEYAWNIRLDNCNFGNPSGYMIWALDCNTLDIVDCYGNGGAIKNKGVFLFSNADGFMSHSKFGGVSGPALWIAGQNAWQQQYTGNFLYNNFNGQFTVSGIVSDELTIGTHDFETGMPMELSPITGATLPTLTRYPSVALDSHIFWAIKTASNKIKIAYSYEDAMGGTALAITGGSGTYYAWHGAAAGAYLSGGANANVLANNRCDQNQKFGIALNKATENVVIGNLLNLNGFESLTGLPEATTSAGVYLRNGAANNIIMANSMKDWGASYAQTYGVWIDDNVGKYFLGQNAFKSDPSMVDKLISTTGNTPETPVLQTATGATINTDSTGSPLTLTRDGTLNQWKFELSSTTNVMRIKNSYAGNTALSISSPTTDTSVTLGSAATITTPRNSLLYGESISSAAGTDITAADTYIVVGNGTGAATSGGKFRIYTPDVGTTGTTPQSTTEKFAVMRQGGIIVKPITAAPTLGIADGAIYANSADKLFYGRHASAWQTMSNPNIIGVATVPDDGNATFTFSPLVSRWNQYLNVPITGTRTVTLSTSFAQQGTEATFTRTAASTGASNWAIGSLKNLAVGQWCKIGYDGSAWVLLQFGSL